MERFNEKMIQAFSAEHSDMHPDSPNVHFDDRISHFKHRGSIYTF